MVRRLKDSWVCSVTRVLLKSALPLVVGMWQMGLRQWSIKKTPGGMLWGSGVVPEEDRSQDREIQHLHSEPSSLKMETLTLP